MTSTGNIGLDALADAIAQRVIEQLRADREPEYIDAREAARRMGRSARSVTDMAARGTIPSHRQGKRVMFRWSEIECKLNENG